MSATGEGDAGFTLLEMLVVLTIAGLLAGLGFPRLQTQIAAQEWRTSVVSITALLRTARAQAMRRDRVASVSITPDGHTLRVSDGPSLALPASVRVSLPRSLRFHGDGSASGGTLGVTGKARTAMIAVAPATGLPAVTAS